MFDPVIGGVDPRTQAYCPTHFKLEPIKKVRVSTRLREVATVEAYQSSVQLECGEGLTIVTSAVNLRAMGAK